jgi:hypothetical protein
MRAYEFMFEEKIARRLLPRDPRTIELHKDQYELLKKRAEAEIKMKQAKEEDDQVIDQMATSATDKRMNAGKFV